MSRDAASGRDALEPRCITARTIETRLATHACVLALLCVPAVFGQRGEGDAGLGRLISHWQAVARPSESLPPKCQRVQPGRRGCGAPRSIPRVQAARSRRGDHAAAVTRHDRADSTILSPGLARTFRRRPRPITDSPQSNRVAQRGRSGPLLGSRARAGNGTHICVRGGEAGWASCGGGVR